MKLDLRLYAIVDPDCAGGFALPDLAHRLVQGGATLLQLRDKNASTRVMVERARAIKAALRDSGVPLLVNDRVDVALAAGADGVHVGQDDMSAADARQLLGAEAIIGLSVKTLAQAQAAPLDRLDYVCIGGVFATTSKDNPDPPVGVSGFAAICDAVRQRVAGFPVGAIAGINADNAADVVAVGADGVAVISALSLTADPAAAAARLRAEVDRGIARQSRAARL